VEFPETIPTPYVIAACTALTSVIGWLLMDRRDLIRELKASTQRHIDMLTRLIETTKRR